jgi:hypothetical protein
MKKMKKLLLLLTFMPGMVNSQLSEPGQSSLGQRTSEFKLAQADRICLGMNYQDSLVFAEVMQHMNHAAKKSSAGCVLGTIANLSILLNAGVLDGDLEPHQGLIGIAGFSTGLTRVILSTSTPNHLHRVEDLVRASGSSIWSNENRESALQHLNVALNASKAVTICSAFGIILITSGIVGIGYDTDVGPVLYCIGWGFGLAGLTSSFIVASHVSKAKRTLLAGKGSLGLGLSSQGIGLNYRWH